MTLKLTTNDPGFTLKADESGKVLDIDIFDEIDGGYWGGVSAKAVKAALDEHRDAEQINVAINSPGGFVTDSMAIYNLLKQHDAAVNVTVYGLAASGASVIAMAGDVIRMSEGSYMMIHRAAGLTIGNANVHGEQMALLEKMDGQLAALYARRTGGDAETILGQMTDETWFTPEEAVADGFADEAIESESKMAASFGRDILKRYHLNNTPGNVAERFFTKTAQPDTGQADETPENHMSDITPEAFAELHPEAVNAWKAEARADAEAKATAESERIAAINDKWGGTDPAFALAAIVADDSFERAAVNFADKALADLNAKDAELAEARKKADAASDGADPVNLADLSDEEQEDEDPKRAKVQKAAAKMKGYARTQYIRSAGFDPADFTFDD